MLIELNLDLTDLEKDIEQKKQEEKINQLKEIEKNKIYKEMAHKYQERLATILTDGKS